MKTILHKNETRGKASHGGWLSSYHSFSFANYYNPERMGFGALRVINDDIIAPSMGFGTHPHRNMEIISVPISGSLKHKDNMGNEFVISDGEIQTMTAGTGVLHSEFNASDNEEANFLQIWVLPKEHNVRPSYSQKKFSKENRRNCFQLIVSPDGRDGSASINQDAFFSLVDLDEGVELSYEKYLKDNGLYFFVVEGQTFVEGCELYFKDGLGVIHKDNVLISSKKHSRLLIMEIPF